MTLDLDQIDAAVARIEAVSRSGLETTPTSPPDTACCRATRDPAESWRLLEKYIDRISRIEQGWVAVDHAGRASTGPSLAIAVCLAIIGTQRTAPHLDQPAWTLGRTAPEDALPLPRKTERNVVSIRPPKTRT